ncbi:MAG: hypothetical protein R3E58_06665 [Phycisphaerae bacterium]
MSKGTVRIQSCSAGSNSRRICSVWPSRRSHGTNVPTFSDVDDFRNLLVAMILLLKRSENAHFAEMILANAM